MLFRSVFLDVITGIRTSVLCGHTDPIYCLAFSQDGTLLLSGSNDKTARVWDVQTGGIIRTFDYDPYTYFAASISSDGAMVAFGTDDGIVRLCGVRTGDCHFVKMYDGRVTAIEFSPFNSRRFISSSGRIVRQWDIDDDQIGQDYNVRRHVWTMNGAERHWDIDGHQFGTSYHEADHVKDLAWTRDGTHFVSCGGKVATVRDAQSGAVVVRLDVPDQSSSFDLGCFSPDGRFVACAADTTIWVWDISISRARLVRHLVGHSSRIKFLAFSSSLISGGFDRSIRFWKSSSFSMDLTTSDQTTARGSFPRIESIKLFAEEGTVVTSDGDGVVKVWDVMTGRCKSSFSTPAKGERDTHLACDTLIIVWCPDPHTSRDRPRAVYGGGGSESESESESEGARAGETAIGYHIWDVYKGQLIRKFPKSFPYVLDLKISGDGSKIFGRHYDYIAAVSTQTGEEVGRVELESSGSNLFVRGSQVWVNRPRPRTWDFGGPGAPPLEEFPDGPRLELVDPVRYANLTPCWMEDTVTKRRVFRSLEKYLDCGRQLKWDGRYLFNLSPSGEIIMIIDFDPVCPSSGS